MSSKRTEVKPSASLLKAAAAKQHENKDIELGLHQKFGEAAGDEDVVTAISLARVGNYWTTVTYRIQGNRVLEIVADEPSSKAISADCFKIAAQKAFLD